MFLITSLSFKNTKTIVLINIKKCVNCSKYLVNKLFLCDNKNLWFLNILKTIRKKKS